MIEGRTEIKKAFLSEQTRRVTFQIVNKFTGVGFQPATLAMTVYDVTTAFNQKYDTTITVTDPNHVAVPITSAIVNGRDDVDVIGFVDSEGMVDLFLEVEDTAIPIPALDLATPYQRWVVFRWTWDSPAKTGKHEIILNILPDRETVAT